MMTVTFTSGWPVVWMIVHLVATVSAVIMVVCLTFSDKSQDEAWAWGIIALYAAGSVMDTLADIFQ